MKTFVSHDTALWYWRMYFPLDGELGRPARASRAEACACDKADVLASVPESMAEACAPLDVLVFDERDKRRSSAHRCRQWNTAIPPRAFYRLGDMFVSSPEFTFLQMATRLSVAQLAELGCELCGLYVKLPRGQQHPGSADARPTRAAPLTTPAKLRAFVQAAEGARGRRAALRALRFVVEASRSPMETLTCLYLCLPVMLGGYGLPLPQMNDAIELDDEARGIARRRWAAGDLVWPEAKLDLEYHGDVHVGADAMKSDVGRTLGIEHMGWRVVTLTGPQVLGLDEFELVAREVARRLHRRLYPRVLGATPARLRLRDELQPGAW